MIYGLHNLWTSLGLSLNLRSLGSSGGRIARLGARFLGFVAVGGRLFWRFCLSVLCLFDRGLLMGGMGRYPKPDGERLGKSPVQAFDWVFLPAAGRLGLAPKLPSRAGGWSNATKVWWADLWSSPQAAAWDQSGRTLSRLALLHELLFLGESGVAGIAAEMRQIEDRHGLSPKALLQLRWRIVEAGDVVELVQPSVRRGVLKVVDGLA